MSFPVYHANRQIHQEIAQVLLELENPDEDDFLELSRRHGSFE
jgi:hypothetical protein